MAERLFQRPDGSIPHRYQRMMASAETKGKDQIDRFILRSMGNARVTTVHKLKALFVDQAGCKYYYDKPDPSDATFSQYSVRLPKNKQPGKIYFNPSTRIIELTRLQTKQSVAINEIKWFQLPAPGYAMGRISMKIS